MRANVIAIDEDTNADELRKLNRNPDGALAAEIEAASQRAYEQGYRNLTIAVESDYHEGWERHFEETMTNSSVTVSRNVSDLPLDSNSTVRVDVAGVFDPDPARFIVEADRGLDGPAVKDPHIVKPAGNGSNAGTPNHTATFEAEVKNVGEQTGDTDVTLSIDNGTVTETKSVTDLDADSSKSVEFEFTYSNLRDNLTTGQSYDYTYQIDGKNALKATGSFFLAEESGPYLEVTDLQTNTNPGATHLTISAKVTNTGGENATNGKLKLDIEADEYEDAYSPQKEDVTRDVGESALVSWEVNKTKLLTVDHDFTLTALGSSESVSGSFTIGDGVGVAPGESDLEIPKNTEVNVSVVGTELGTNPYGWEDRVDWAPTFATLYTAPIQQGDSLQIGGQETEGETNPEPVPSVEWHDENLNQWDDPLPIYSHNFTTSESVRLMVEGQSYEECGSYEQVGSDGTHAHYSCPTGEEEEKWITASADPNNPETNVRVLNERNNILPEFDPGVEVQHTPKELLDREGVDVNVTERENGSAEIHLDENEFLFVFELSHEPGDGHPDENCDFPEDMDPEDYWDRALNCDGDPDFNDMLVHVDITRNDPESPKFKGRFNDGNGNTATFGPGDGGDDDGSDYQPPEVGVGSDELIIW
nr:CARDB domain-containing protein [Halovivax limisalsi]